MERGAAAHTSYFWDETFALTQTRCALQLAQTAYYLFLRACGFCFALAQVWGGGEKSQLASLR